MTQLLYPRAVAHSTSERTRSGLLVLAIALAWLGCAAWMRPLFLPDEGRYVGVAWEMLSSGNWVIPTLDGMPFFHKPPLFYWLTALAMNVFGANEWAARGASILGASAGIAILYVTTREWLGERAARMAVLVLATQPLFFGAAQFANLDMLVAACIAATILLGARAALLFEDGQPDRPALSWAYVAAALGVLAKGLIGLVIPLLVLLVWLALARRWRTLLRLCWPPGLLLFAALALPWFAAVQWRYPGFLHYFVVVQHIQRFAGTGFNNVEAWWFYVPVLFVLTLPWSAWLLIHVRRSRRLDAARPGIVSLMLVWLAVVVGFFSLPQSKLVGYILPALWPIAVLVAYTVSSTPQAVSDRARRLWWGCAAVAVCVCVGLSLAFALVHPKSSRALALQLDRHRIGHAGVAFVDEYPYDVPFYLRDASPIVVVSNWDPTEIQHHDNWRKELADAGSFAPNLAAQRLVGDERFRSMLCDGKLTFVIAKADEAHLYPFLAAAERVAFQGDRGLWHVDASDAGVAAALGCAATVGARTK